MRKGSFYLFEKNMNQLNNKPVEQASRLSIVKMEWWRKL